MQSYFDILNSDVLISIFMELTSNDITCLYKSQLINFNNINFKDLYQRLNEPIIRQTWIHNANVTCLNRGPILTYNRCDKVLEIQHIFKSKNLYEILSSLLLNLKNEKLVFTSHKVDFIKFFRSLDNMYLLYLQHRELYDIIANYRYDPTSYILLDYFNNRVEKVGLFPIDELLRNSSPIKNIFAITDLFNFINLDIIKATDYFFKKNHTIFSQSMIMGYIYKHIDINKENTIKFIKHIMTNYSDIVDIFEFVKIRTLFMERKPEILELLLKYNINKYLAVNDGIDELIELKRFIKGIYEYYDKDDEFGMLPIIVLNRLEKTKDQIYSEHYDDYVDMIEILKEYFIQSEKSSICFKIINSIFKIIDDF